MIKNRMHLYNYKYDNKTRFCSYWHQINEIVSLGSSHVLYIGIGSGFTCNYLSRLGIKVISIDIDSNLSPQIISSVLSIPLKTNSFDTVACFQVLEHIPFSLFGDSLKEINRVCKSYSLLSLPDFNRVYRFLIELPIIGRSEFMIPGFNRHLPERNFDKDHCWEINKASYPLNLINDQISKSGFDILKNYRVFEKPKHRFFILKKRK